MKNVFKKMQSNIVKKWEIKIVCETLGFNFEKREKSCKSDIVELFLAKWGSQEHRVNI